MNGPILHIHTQVGLVNRSYYTIQGLAYAREPYMLGNTSAEILDRRERNIQHNKAFDSERIDTYTLCDDMTTFRNSCESNMVETSPPEVIKRGPRGSYIMKSFDGIRPHGRWKGRQTGGVYKDRKKAGRVRSKLVYRVRTTCVR